MSKNISKVQKMYTNISKIFCKQICNNISNKYFKQIFKIMKKYFMPKNNVNGKS